MDTAQIMGYLAYFLIDFSKINSAHSTENSFWRVGCLCFSGIMPLTMKYKSWLITSGQEAKCLRPKYNGSCVV